MDHLCNNAGGSSMVDLADLERRVTRLEAAQNDNTGTLKWIAGEVGKIAGALDNIAATMVTKGELDAVKTDVAAIKTDLAGFRRDLPGIVTGAVRDALKP